MGRGVKIPLIGVHNTMGMRSIYHWEVVKIPRVGIQNTIDRGVNITWVGVSK